MGVVFGWWGVGHGGRSVEEVEEEVEVVVVEPFILLLFRVESELELLMEGVLLDIEVGGSRG